MTRPFDLFKYQRDLYEYQDALRELNDVFVQSKSFLDSLGFYLDRRMGTGQPLAGEMSGIVYRQMFESVDMRIRSAQARLTKATIRVERVFDLLN